MKNTKLALIMLGVGTAGFLAALYFYLFRAPLDFYQIAIVAMVLVIVPVSAIVGLRNLKKQKAGIPIEDELSLRIKEKAAARSFAVSLYMWLAILLLCLSSSREILVPVLAGIVGMGGVFLVNWSLLSHKGIEE